MSSPSSEIDFDNLSKVVLSNSDDSFLKRIKEEQNFNFSINEFEENIHIEHYNEQLPDADTEKITFDFDKISSLFQYLDAELATLQQRNPNKTKKSTIKPKLTRSISASMSNLNATLITATSSSAAVFKIPSNPYQKDHHYHHSQHHQHHYREATDISDDFTLKSLNTSSNSIENDINLDLEHNSIIAALSDKQNAINKIYNNYVEFKILHNMIIKKLNVNLNEKLNQYHKDYEKLKNFNYDLNKLIFNKIDTDNQNNVKGKELLAFHHDEELQIEKIHGTIDVVAYVKEKHKNLYKNIENSKNSDMKIIINILDDLLLSIPCI